MKIAVIGSGVAGLGAAWALNRAHDVTVYEAESRLGGHANTLEVEIESRRIAVDTGFIVYNEPGYPNLTRLFASLAVETHASDMSFAVSLDGGRFEYAGDPRRFFGQKRNLLRPRSWRILRDILRFYREAPALLNAPEHGLSLGDYLEAEDYSRAFVEDHLRHHHAALTA